MSDIKSVTDTSECFKPPAEFAGKANILPTLYYSLIEQAQQNYAKFWADLANANLSWDKPFTQILNDTKAPFYKWFEDGELNVSFNCLDRHLTTIPDKTAIIFEADNGASEYITYKQLHNEEGGVLGNDNSGYLVIKQPFPSQIRTIWGDPERYKSTYYPKSIANGKYYVAGDSAHKDRDGYFWILGRIDDVLNVSGHRLSTMEIESALAAHHSVSEAAVVSRPDEIKGESVYAFIVCKSSIVPVGDAAIALQQELVNWVGKEISPIAKPDDICFVDGLPKTRSGKIMRRILRSIARGETITGDTSTLENPAIIDKIIARLLS